MSIDFTKPIQTKNGRKVRVLCIDRGSPYPVVVWFDDEKHTALYTSEGENVIGEESPLDLMNVPEQVTVDLWVNIYPKNWINIYPNTEEPLWSHPTKEKARSFAGSQCIATIHIKRTVPVGHVDED